MNEGSSQRKPRYMYVCMYVCTYVHMYICTYILIFYANFFCRKKRFVKKFFVKGRDRKHKGDGRSRGDNQSGSDEDPSPEHDQKTVKVNRFIKLVKLVLIY